jgi:hypothetical protein
MDGQRFDELTKALAAGVSRRRFVGIAASGVAAVAALFRREAGAAPSRCAVGCAGLPGPQKAACTQACRRCGGDFDRVCSEFGPFGPTSFTCCPEGTFCNFELGVCEALTICPTGETAENCFADITTNCGEGGVCALVEHADAQDCVCVERECTFIPCTTDADCTESGGVCATIPGCCPETTFCAIPCGSAAATSTAAGWGK